MRPGGTGYDAARSLLDAMIDRRPVVIAQCANDDDVVSAVGFGREAGLPPAVRSGGHSVAGMSTVDDGLVVDVREMKTIEVDPGARTARCGAGLTWGEFDAATQEQGLATTGGRVSSTGVAGVTLGGGSGWLKRKYGLACDNLIAVELVTADGEQVRASDSENPDLFWALHGGGGNFGVATARVQPPPGRPDRDGRPDAVAREPRARRAAGGACRHGGRARRAGAGGGLSDRPARRVDDVRHMTWARTIPAEMKRFTSGGVYLNFIGNEGQDRVRAAFGDKYDRLAQLKGRYDPDNFFRFNQKHRSGAGGRRDLITGASR